MVWRLNVGKSEYVRYRRVPIVEDVIHVGIYLFDSVHDFMLKYYREPNTM